MGGYFVTNCSRLIACTLFCWVCSSGHWGHSSELQFEGNRTFPASALQKKLQIVPEYYVCTHLKSDRREEAELVQRSITNGYLDNGFPDVNIVATVQENSAQPIVVKIEEGQQFHNGPIRVSGVDEALQGQILERLSTKYPSDDAFPTYVNLNGKSKLIWKNSEGKAASLSSAYWKSGSSTSFFRTDLFFKSVEKVIRKLGYPDAKVEVSVVRADDQKTAELHVHVLEIGEVRKANNIHVVGVSDEQRDEFLDYLHLEPGDSVDTTRVREMIRLLWESGRFSKHRIVWDADQSDTLKIDVEVVSSVPWLNQPLDEKAQAILRCQKWIDGIAERGDEVVASAADGFVKMIVSPKGTFLDASLPPSVVDEVTALERFRVLVGNQGLLMDISSQDYQFEMPFQNLEVQFDLEIESALQSEYQAPDSEDEQQLLTGRFFLGGKMPFGEGSVRESNVGLVTFSLDTSPAGLLPIVYRSDISCQIVGPNLEIEEGQNRIVVEVETGRLVSCSAADAEFHFEKDTLANAVAEIPHKPNHCDASKPFNSFIKYCFEPTLWDYMDAIEETPSDEIALRKDTQTALIKLMDSDVLKNLESFLRKNFVENQAEEVFTIPLGNGSGPPILGLYRHIASLSLTAGTYFDQKVWPSQVAAAEAMLLIEDNRMLEPIINSIMDNPQNGPICYAVLASCMKYHSHPRTNEVANRGLNMLRDSNIESDWRALSASIPQEMIDNLFAVVRSFTPEELDALDICIDVPQVTTFLETIYKSDADKPANLSAAVFKAQGTFLHDILDDAAKAKIGPQSSDSVHHVIDRSFLVDLFRRSAAELIVSR